MCDETSISSCCFTGYRPNKFPFSIEKREAGYEKFDNALLGELTKLINGGCRVFYTGMAMGFDIIAAEAVLFLKSLYPDIKLYCIVPFEEQERFFGINWRKRYNSVVEQSDGVTVLSQFYFNGCYQRRNQYMVDKSDCVLTWYDGQSGGTRNTLKYAQKNLKYIINANPDYSEEFTNPQFHIEFK